VTRPEALASASGSLLFSVMTHGRCSVELARRRSAGLHDLLLRRRLHDVAEALDAAEHRDRRRRRRLPAGDRLGGGRPAIIALSMPLLLFAIIFFWTPPHFWALALYRSPRLRARRRADAAHLGLAFAVWRSETTEAATMKAEKRLFAFSILYLFIAFAALALDRMLLA
jgi:hypothetical protein